MNAFTPIGTPIGAPLALGRFGRLRECPMPGEDCIPVTINGTRVLVYYQAGRPTWCHIQQADGIIIPGVRASEAVPDSLHGEAARVADGFLAGLRQAGEYPAPEPLPAPVPAWYAALLSVAFGAAALVVMWGVVFLVALRDWQR